MTLAKVRWPSGKFFVSDVESWTFGATLILSHRGRKASQDEASSTKNLTETRNYKHIILLCSLKN